MRARVGVRGRGHLGRRRGEEAASARRLLLRPPRAVHGGHHRTRAAGAATTGRAECSGAASAARQHRGAVRVLGERGERGEGRVQPTVAGLRLLGLGVGLGLGVRVGIRVRARVRVRVRVRVAGLCLGGLGGLGAELLPHKVLQRARRPVAVASQEEVAAYRVQPTVRIDLALLPPALGLGLGLGLAVRIDLPPAWQTGPAWPARQDIPAN